MTDLNFFDTSLKANTGVEYTLKHPATGEDLDISFTLLGVDSDAFQELERAKKRTRLKTQKIDITVEELENQTLDTLTAMTIGWKNVVLDGKELEFSPENARRIYSKFPWVREQIDGVIGNRALFLPDKSLI